MTFPSIFHIILAGLPFRKLCDVQIRLVPSPFDSYSPHSLTVNRSWKTTRIDVEKGGVYAVILNNNLVQGTVQHADLH